MRAKTIPEPWKLFLEEINAQLTEPAVLHCLGGFVLEILYGLLRSTGDIDAPVLLLGRDHKDTEFEINRLRGKRD